MDDTVRSTEDVERTLHTRTLASIPSLSEAKRSLRQLSAALTKRNGNSRNHRELLLHDHNQPGLTEIYRQLRTSMLLSSAEGTLQTILVTASMPNEGKTTTAINTALTLARAGVKVLLIDADTRHPSIHGALGLDNDEGLSTILSSEKQQAETLSLIKRHEASGLFVLTSGPADPNFTEFLGSEQMRRLMTTLRANFNYIIVDSPPVLHFADGTLISQMVDGVLLVVNSGKTSREVVRQSQQMLQDVGANVVGVVLNNVKTLSYDYSYYQQYYSPDAKNGNGKAVESMPGRTHLPVSY
jgi:receptor protein-tyrosine kinase